MRISLKAIHKEDEVSDLSKTYQKYSFVDRVSADNCAYDEYEGVEKSTGSPVHILVINIVRLNAEQRLGYAQKFTIAQRMQHPSMLKLYDFWFDKDRLFVVTDTILGVSVDELVEEGRLKLETTLEIATQLSELLEYLHREKIYYTALRPRNIYVGQDYRVSVRPVYVERLMIDALLNYSDEASFLELSEPKCESLLPSNCELDIESLGAMVCYLSTGYAPVKMDPRRWCRYGLNPDLEEAVSRAIRREGYHAYTKVEEFGAVLEKMHGSDLSVSLAKGCIQSKLHHFKSSQNWTEETTILSAIRMQQTQVMEADESKQEQKQLLNHRYLVGDCISFNVLNSVFKGRDKTLNDRRVWIHLHHYNGNAEWSYDFRQIANRMSLVSHPHITQVFDAAVLKKSAYIATQEERGERLSDFAQRHIFTRADIEQFCYQIGDAIRAANEFDFHLYSLSLDTISVYKNPDGGYFFRVMALGGVQLLALDHPNGKWLDMVKESTTLAPELYLNNPQGFLTTQFIFGSLIFALLANGHPSSKSTLHDAYLMHSDTLEMSIFRYRTTLDPVFVNWLHRLLSPHFQDRFQTSEEMLEPLKRGNKM